MEVICERCIQPHTEYSFIEKYQNEDVYFDIDKFDLLNRSKNTLTNLTQILVKYPNIKIEISGHTSTTGEYNHNVDLSKNRAISVRKFLMLQGISGERLTTAGFGPDRPIALNNTEPNRQLNRRVEVKILSK